MSYITLIWFYLTINCLPGILSDFGKDDANDNRRLQEWIKTEEEFRKLDDHLKIALNDDWTAFKRFVTDKILEHHSTDNDCFSTSPTDTCVGKGSLTESEFILHQSLDVYAAKFGDENSLNQYHKLVHTVFETTRELLKNLSLIQNSEYNQPTVLKQVEMHRRYSS